MIDFKIEEKCLSRNSLTALSLDENEEPILNTHLGLFFPLKNTFKNVNFALIRGDKIIFLLNYILILGMLKTSSKRMLRFVDWFSIRWPITICFCSVVMQCTSCVICNLVESHRLLKIYNANLNPCCVTLEGGTYCWFLIFAKNKFSRDIFQVVLL